MKKQYIQPVAEIYNLDEKETVICGSAIVNDLTNPDYSDDEQNDGENIGKDPILNPGSGFDF